MKVLVVATRQSPLNAQRWQLVLSCGHRQWITAKNRPARKSTDCPEPHQQSGGVAGERLFSFVSFADWVNHASSRFRQYGVSHLDTLCFDKLGRQCHVGRDFRRAYDEFAFPVTVYRGSHDGNN